MSMFTFTPEKVEDKKVLSIPFFEDARANFAPYYDNRSVSEEKAKSQVSEELAKLGGFVVAFNRGSFDVDGAERLGYKIDFSFGGVPGVIMAAGLPSRLKRSPDLNKSKLIRTQALLNVRDWLKAAVTLQIFSSNTSPLLPHLLLPDGKTTLAEYIVTQGRLPMLGKGGEDE